jgi:adenine-specific DNA-methyltransferase
MSYAIVQLTDNISLYRGDNREVMAALKDRSIDTIIADPPYLNVLKKSEWDRVWKTREDYLAFMTGQLAAYQRLLKLNGSFFIFAFPHMAAHISVETDKYFNILNHIVWEKISGGRASRNVKENLRSLVSLTERIIFAEHKWAHYTTPDNEYINKTTELRTACFSEIRDYLRDEILRSGVSKKEIGKFLGISPKSRLIGHYMENTQWIMPTREKYEQMRDCLNQLGNNGSDYLKRDYDDLKRDYDDLKRPFFLTNQDQYGDVWRFNTAQFEKMQHPAQKPIALLLYMLKIATRPSCLILDPFMGSGTTGVAAAQMGRPFIGIEQDSKYFEIAVQRISAALAQPRLFVYNKQEPNLVV